jgi:hypothetical protein
MTFIKNTDYYKDFNMFLEHQVLTYNNGYGYTYIYSRLEAKTFKRVLTSIYKTDHDIILKSIHNELKK